MTEEVNRIMELSDNVKAQCHEVAQRYLRHVVKNQTKFHCHSMQSKHVCIEGSQKFIEHQAQQHHREIQSAKARVDKYAPFAPMRLK